MATATDVSENGKRIQHDQVTQEQVTAFILEPDREMVYQTGYTLHSYTLRKEGEGWLLVIRVNAQKGGRLVTFLKTDSIYTCFEVWYQAMVSKAITLKWYPDKFQ